MFQKTIDLKYGFDFEEKNFELLRDKFDSTLKRTKKSDTFDYEGEKCVIELKSRRNTKNKYPTTMVGYNKLIKAKNINKLAIFCFQFTDGLYYYIYDSNDYENGIIDIKIGGRCDRGSAEFKEYAFIDVSALKPLH